MGKLILIVVVGMSVEAIGVVYLTKGVREAGGAAQISVAEILGLIGRIVTNRNVLWGTFLEALFFVTLMWLLSKYDASLIWPLTSLGFVVTALAAKIILHEQVSWVRWAGVFLIMCGAALVSYSEQLKEKPLAAPSPPDPSAQAQPR